MDGKKKVEFRYYDIPKGDIVYPLTGPAWIKAYGEGREKLHFHNYYEVGICSEGEGEMTLGEETVRFYPGCISLIPTTELHTTNTFGETAGWEWMYFDMPELLAEIYPNDEILRESVLQTIRRQGRLFTPEENIQKMTFLVRSIFSEMANREYMYRDMVRNFLVMLIVEIIRKLQDTEIPDSVSSKMDIFPAIAFIKDNCGRQIRIGELSKCCGMSESYFRRVFEKYMNMRPLDYVNFVRVQKSCALLRETTLTVAEVSERVGYESVSSFIRNFRRIIGCTPLRWKTDEKYKKNRFLKYNVTALRGWEA